MRAMAIYVVAAVAAEMGCRIQTPALMTWKQGFALAWKATQKSGLASPSDGWYNEPETSDTFPEINVLLVDRSNVRAVMVHTS